MLDKNHPPTHTLAKKKTNQVHLTNAAGDEGAYDAGSGVVMQYTPAPRRYDMGVLTLAALSFELPPGQAAQLQAVLQQLLRQSQMVASGTAPHASHVSHPPSAPLPPPSVSLHAQHAAAPTAAPAAAAAPEWAPSQGIAAFAAIMHAFSRHQWTPAESALLVQFRAKYGA